MYLRGIDVSHHNIVENKIHHKHHLVQGIDWTQVKASGVTFAFTKASEGLGMDWTFPIEWPAIKAAGLIRGAFHFGRANKDAVAQAKYFYNLVKPASGDLHLALDLEKDDGKSPSELRAWAKAFLDEIERLTGKPAIFYSFGPFIMDDMGNPRDNWNCPLWLAAYVPEGRLSKYMPRAWTDWTFWQWAQMKATPGTPHGAEQDYFKGTLAELQQLTYS
jgi:lysozyme